MEKLIKRINELAAIKKERELTDSEKKEQAKLRAEYIKNFKKGFEEQLASIKVVDSEGNDVTPEKLKEKQKEGQK
ncbi:hypothetical protein SCHIN_v1c06600 [Spiroplasma chinense]|uniref:Uncharacterized protein n=1 Tax=Spiroplasma chinense TaxID=216932 RepID=A0A5B9Y6G5_9MOLU|nr:hypothetical protein SCHIN_v1c06600 [Spiroplasma chinense]